MATREIKTSIKLDGEKEFKKVLGAVNSELKTLKSEMALVDSKFKGSANSTEALTSKQKILKQQYEQQEIKVKALNRAYDEAKEAFGENSAKADEYKRKLNYATIALDDMGEELKQNEKYLDEAKKSTDGCATSIDRYGKEVQEAEKKTSKFGEIFKGAFWANLASQAFTAITSKIKEFARASIDAADKYGTLAEIYGLSSDRIQELEFAGIRLDVSLETMTGSLTKLARNMNTARAGSKLQTEAFNKLGIEITNTDGSLRDANIVFYEAIDALGKVHGETERDAIAMQLFGKSAMDMNPLIKAGSAELEALSEKAHEMGAVMSEDAVNALDNLDETLEQIKMSAQAFVGEALAAIIGDGKTAADVMNDLQDSLANTSNTQSLIDKYHRLSAELASGNLTAEEAKQKTAELEQAKQDLIAASNGVVTAFDIENGTFGRQVGVLEDLTQSEKEYLKYKLTYQVLENTGVALTQKAADADTKYTKAKEGLVIANKAVAETQEAIANGQKKTWLGADLEEVLKSQITVVEYYKDEMREASLSQTEVSESALKAEEAIKSLVEGGYMSAAEACETFALSNEELEAVLNRTGDTAESNIPQVQALKESIDSLNAEYEAAKETVAATLDSIVGGWQAVPKAVAISAEELTANLQSQLDYMASYRENLDALVSRQVPGVDMSALVTSLSDGSVESAQILAGLATATDEELTLVSQLLEQKDKDFETFTSQVGAEKINLDGRMAELVEGATKTISEDMDLSDEAKISAVNTINGYINGVLAQSGSLNLTMTKAAQDALNAWRKVFDERSPSREMTKSGKHAIEGAIIGVEGEQGKLVTLYTKMGENLLTGLAKGMKDSSGKVMETADDITKELAKRVGDIVNVFSTSADIADLQYKLWEMTNADATEKQKTEQRIESLNRQTEIQKSMVDSVSDAYKKMVEMTGENSDESLRLQKQLLQEQIELENLKSTIKELTEVKKSAYNTDNLSKMAEQEFKLWSLENQSASDSEKLAKQTELLALKYEMQGENISTTESALADMVEQYGANSAESVKLQEQLLKEKIAYMELKAQIDEVNRARGYVGGSNIGASGYLQTANIWAGMKQDINTDISSIGSVSKQDVGGMIAGAVNAMSMQGGNQRITVEIPLYVNGREFYRASINDLWSVMSSNPRVVSDAI